MEMKTRVSKVIQMHYSLAIVLPKDFVVDHNILKGDKVALIYNGDLRVIPADVGRVRV